MKRTAPKLPPVVHRPHPASPAFVLGGRLIVFEALYLQHQRQLRLAIRCCHAHEEVWLVAVVDTEEFMRNA